MLNHRQPAVNASSYYATGLTRTGSQHERSHVTPLLGGVQQTMMFAPAHELAQQSSTAASGFIKQNFRRFDRPASTTTLVHRPRGRRNNTQQQRRLPYPPMAFTPQMTDDDLAELQKLSADYEPEIIGPLVGPRQKSTAITTEYASADPAYQQKTATLPTKYPYYRTVRGDGRCGWRAIGYAFLERLIFTQDPHKLLQEEARLRSLANVINAAGYDPDLYEDFADELYGLVRSLSDAVRSGTGEETLLSSFNDDLLQQSVITHLRLLTAAWMKTHMEEYVPFTPGLDVEAYCNTTILPMGSEIDHLGLSALNDVLLSPAAIGLEVLYLDRSQGPEIDLHNFTRAEQINAVAASVRLLYRPGHYDILYQAQDVPPSPVAAYLQTSAHNAFEKTPQLNLLTTIPGMSSVRRHGYLSGQEFDLTPAYSFPATPQSCVPVLPSSTPSSIVPQTRSMSRQQSLSSQQSALFLQPSLTMPPTQLPDLYLHTPQHDISHTAYMPQVSGSGGPFRPSHWELEPDIANATAQMPLQTSIFRNSHFNTAHFNNPEFQPEEWSPQQDYDSGHSSTTKSKHKSSAQA